MDLDIGSQIASLPQWQKGDRQGELVLPASEKCFPHPILCHDQAPPTQAGKLFSMTGRHLQYLHTTRLVYLHKVPKALRCGFSCCICFDAKSTNERKNFPVLNVPGNSLIFCLRGWGLNFKKHIFFFYHSKDLL